jgi:hypothetical protein
MITAVFDTTIGSYNLGNNIIMDSVYQELDELFPSCQYYKLAPIDIGPYTRGCIAKSDLVFFGGTNSLNSDMWRYKQWDLRPRNIFGVRNVILLGLGWWQYETKPISNYTRFLLRRALSNEFVHAVRDDYTKKKLETIGVRSYNTGCPTLWRINDEVIKQIPGKKQKDVVFTLTDYRQDVARDSSIIRACLDDYDNVYCFPQGIGDINYVECLGFKNQVEFLTPRVEAFDKIMETGSADYIGTRVHAGIRAIQKSRYAIIIGVDNRAVEMGKDFGLPVVSAEKVDNLSRFIKDRAPINLSIPFGLIQDWKAQFVKYYDI